MAQDFRNQTNLPRGLRNNNPGNLVKGINWQGAVGDDGRFIIFQNIAYGIRAIFMDLLKDYFVDGQNTITDLINEYAPAFENNTSNYINYVSKRTGIAPNTIFKPTAENFQSIVRAILEMENGRANADLIKATDITEAWALVPAEKKK